jgi:ATP-dependent helicase HepA
MENHRYIAAITGKILNNDQLDKEDIARLSCLLDTNNPDVSMPESRQKIVDELLDRFGVGRAMFRNTRQTVGGFPKRIVDLAPLSATPGDTETLQKEQLHILDGCNIGDDAMSYTHDPRFPYFAELLKKYPDDKFLVICRSKETAKSVEKAILRHVNVAIALFHEELSLIQRDRNAAWFAEPEGARILLCSEIGSEGRNFQFCRHLVMWDLPPDCELIEQRIGRVDRIGQTRDIIIHVPYILSTASEVFARWFGDAAGIFASTVPAAQEVFEVVGADLVACAKSANPRSKDWKNELDKIIKESLLQIKEASLRLEAGRDRLLEMHSFRPAEALSIVNKIKNLDADTWLESFMVDLLKNNGVFSECIDHRTYKLWSESPLDEVFPALRASRPVITFDRATALAREDMEFVTIDHPAVKSGLDMFLGSDSGNACFAEWQNAKGNGLLLDAVFVVECMAPPHLNAQRFMPPTPLRILVDHAMRDRSDVFTKIDLESKLVACTQSPIADDENADIAVLVAMQKAAMQFAEVRSRTVVEAAVADVLRTMGSEVDRLVALSKVNEAISAEDIKAAKDELQNMHDAIKNAAPRLDSVRLILVQGK